MTYPITLSMTSSSGLDDVEQVRAKVIEPWAASARTLAPTHLQVGEPVRQRFDPLTSEIPSGAWAARRGRPRVEASFAPGFERIHADLSVSIKGSTVSDVVSLADALAASMQVHFGFVHRLTDAERDAGRAKDRQDVRIVNFRTMQAESHWGFTAQIPYGLPTLFWRTYFGPIYVDLIGRRRLLDAPVYAVSEISDAIGLTLASDPPTDDSWRSFDAARDLVIEHLGKDLFWPAATRVPRLPPPLP